MQRAGSSSEKRAWLRSADAPGDYTRVGMDVEWNGAGRGTNTGCDLTAQPGLRNLAFMGRVTLGASRSMERKTGMARLEEAHRYPRVTGGL